MYLFVVVVVCLGKCDYVCVKEKERDRKQEKGAVCYGEDYAYVCCFLCF